MPIIGITPVSDKEKKEYTFSYNYPLLVQACGATPLLLPLTESKEDLVKYCEICDGFIFSGGNDINAKLYGQLPHPKAEVYDDLRDLFELSLMKMAINKNIPCLGICRGMQLMNVVYGGDLIQDIPSLRPSSIKHLMPEPYENKVIHNINIVPNSLLQQILGGDCYKVNSIHHQAIGKLAPTLKALAYADDKIIEAIYQPNLKFFLGVQWHPEYNFQVDKNSLTLVKYFIEQCKE